ncbi:MULTISPECIES: hypothetical protein [Pseudomonas]|uniref:hypothetical protein n=1 Tax=Pseudomonas TaxID=286 RepID=UPI00257D6FED|nr:hypothetical protein [Pseudomonas sp.]
MDLHIDDFYKDAAATLLMLYQAFPRKIAVYVEDLIGREEPDEYGLPSKRHLGCLSTMLWLADEGFIRYENTISYDAMDQAVLTERGFLNLTRSVPHVVSNEPALPPSVRRTQATLAYQLRDAMSQQHSERIVRLSRLLFANAAPVEHDTV